MKDLKSFPSIEQFRNVVKGLQMNQNYKGKDENGNPIYEIVSSYPTVNFKGTVKLHGTNGGIVLFKDDTIQYQSRENILTLLKDNAGFMLAMSNVNWKELLKDIVFEDYIAVYGEWCGQGIQKGVSISQLPKMFVIFGVKVDNVWVDSSGISLPEKKVYNINDFTSYSLDIDFNRPDLAQNKLAKLTIEVENCCPVGSKFGVTGIGEGIVWIGTHKEKTYMFKTKGEKHSATKVKTIAAIDTEEVESLLEFVNNTVTQTRLEQGLEKIESLDIKYISDYLRWIVNDIIKEETDVIVKNNINMKKANSMISNKARAFYLEKLKQF